MRNVLFSLLFHLLSYATYAAILILLAVLFLFDGDQYRYKWFTVTGLLAFIFFGFLVSKYLDAGDPDA